MEKSRRLSYNNVGFKLDNIPFFIYSGEMHHVRVHPELWKDRFIRMKRAFLNCTGAYFYWPSIEPNEGIYNFENDCDLEKYFRMATDVGLFTIPRPGPYICAEINSGGHPHWIFKKVKNPRSFEPSYLELTEKYYYQINQIMKKFDLENGTIAKSNLMYQIENEMFSRNVEGGNPEYHLKLRDIARNQYGDSIPFVTNENSLSRGTEVFDTKDIYPDPWATSGIIDKVRLIIKEQPNFPCFGMEIEGGWFSIYGKGDEDLGYSYRGGFDPEWTEFFVKLLIGAGMAGINYYMYHGGTNFGWIAAKYITTTYDYGAPISEWGGLSERYYVTKLIGGFLKSFGSLLSEMAPNDSFILNNKFNNENPDSVKSQYTLTRSQGRYAFFFVYNESKIDKQIQIVLNNPPTEEARFEPLVKVGIPAQNSKILPYQIPLYKESQTIIKFATLEPYYLSQVEYLPEVEEDAEEKIPPKVKGTVILFHGNVGEKFSATFEIKEKNYEISGIVQEGEDLFWRIEENLIVGLITTERAKKTWIIKTNFGELPVISNIYLLYEYSFDNNSPNELMLEFHQEIMEEEVLVSLPWFDCPAEIDVDGKNLLVLFDAEKAVGSIIYDPNNLVQDDYDVNLELVKNTKSIPLGDVSWIYKIEKTSPLSEEKDGNIELSLWQPWKFNQSVEDLGIFSSGYTVYQSQFNLTMNQIKHIKAKKPVNLSIPTVIDSAIILINSKFAGYIQQFGNFEVSEFFEFDIFTDEEKLKTEPATQRIEIYVERIGYYNHGKAEISGLICGPYLNFDNSADQDSNNEKINELPIKSWYLLVEPELKIGDLNQNLSFIKNNYAYEIFESEITEWDPITISDGKHNGIGILPQSTAAIYRTEFHLPNNWKEKEICLELGKLRGHAWIYLNENQLMEYSFKHEEIRSSLDERAGIHLPKTLLKYGDFEKNSIVVKCWISSGEGIFDYAKIKAFDQKAGDHWVVRDRLSGEINEYPKLKHKDLNENEGWQKSFTISDIPSQISSMLWVKTFLSHYKTDSLWAPKYLELSNIPGKVIIWWNGELIGRYWDVGPQKKFYVPEPLLKEENEICLLFIPLGELLEPVKPPMLKAYYICKKSRWKIKF